MGLFKSKNGILIDLNTFDISTIAKAVEITKTLNYVSGYKINAETALLYGLKHVLSVVKENTDKPVLYDHQKFGCDIPEIAAGSILDTIKASGTDGLIIFPLSGKKALDSIISKCQKINLTPVISGDLSYKGYFVDEGGYIDEEIQQRIYLDAASLGVSHFIMSCNRVERIKIYCHQLGSIIGQLKIFFTAIESHDCTDLPDACSQLKQNKVFAISDLKFTDSEDYLEKLAAFWKSFNEKLSIS